MFSLLFENKKEKVRAGYSTEFDGHFGYMIPEDIPNYDAVAVRFGLTADDMIRVHQKHTNRILAVSSANAGEGVTRPGTEEAYDALITDEAGLMLLVVTADCVPVFLYDRVKGVIGLVHSGRAGTMQEIAFHTVMKMQELYGCEPQNIRCVTGPSLCQAHHEVDLKDAEGFAERFTEEEQRRFLQYRREKVYVDMGEAIRISLLRAGIRDDNIEITKKCTFEDKAFPSWRRDHDPKARMLSFIVKGNADTVL